MKQCYQADLLRTLANEDNMIALWKKMKESEHINHSMALQCVDTLLDYVGQRGFEYSDITAASKIHTAVRRSLNNSQKQATITKYFSKYTSVV
jgi:hypothetical protein